MLQQSVAVGCSVVTNQLLELRLCRTANSLSRGDWVYPFASAVDTELPEPAELVSTLGLL